MVYEKPMVVYVKYKEWKEEFYSSLVDNDKMFVCCLCMGRVKHSFLHWLKWHRSDDEE